MMTALLDYKSLPGLNVQHEMTKLSIPTRREALLSRDTKTDSGKLMLFREDTNKLLGTINAGRPLQDHAKTMEWWINQLENTGVPYKLKTSVLNEENLDLYQEYVFDRDVKSPDGELISSMLILRSSLVHNPLSALGATLRYICSNGAYVGRTVGKIVLKPNQMTDFAKLVLHAEVNKLLDSYSRTELFYQTLAEMDLEANLQALFGDPKLPAKLKKSILEKLEVEEVLTVLSEKEPKEGSSAAGALKSEDFENIVESVTFHKNTDLWNVYNTATNLGTFIPRTEQARMHAYNQIDRAFMSLLTA